jgi:KEOPS complex subunit Pcc1
VTVPVFHHTAEFRFTTPHAGQIYRSLLPELAEEVSPRTATRCRIDGETLVLTVEAEDLAALRAALNMFLRLVNVADEMQDIA